MLDYRRVGGTDRAPEYEYLIEGNAAKAGRISFDMDSVDGKMLDHDAEVEHQLCASKLIAHLAHQARAAGTLRGSGTYMWY